MARSLDQQVEDARNKAITQVEADQGGYVPILNGPKAGIAGNVDFKQSDLYRDAVTDWYGSITGPRGELLEQYTYTPELINYDQLQMANPYDFDPMRQEAIAGLESQQMSGYQNALTNVASSTGLTAADRMAMASQFNRGMMDAKAGLSAKLGTAEAQNLWETDRANQDLMNRTMLQNIELQNQAQMQNLNTLMQDRMTRGEIARDMYESDERIRQAKKLGAEL